MVFYSALGPEEVLFHEKTPYLLHCFRNCLVSGSLQISVPNNSQECSETIKKVGRYNLAPFLCPCANKSNTYYFVGIFGVTKGREATHTVK